MVLIYYFFLICSWSSLPLKKIMFSEILKKNIIQAIQAKIQAENTYILSSGKDQIQQVKMLTKRALDFENQWVPKIQWISSIHWIFWSTKRALTFFNPGNLCVDKVLTLKLYYWNDIIVQRGFQAFGE